MDQSGGRYDHQFTGVQIDVDLEILPSKISQAGTGVCVSSDVPAGAEIYRVPVPSVTAVDNEVLHLTCDACFYTAVTKGVTQLDSGTLVEEASIRKLAACGRCKVVSYCTKNCQATAWRSHHKYECRTLADYPKLATLARILFRLLVKQKHNLLKVGQWESILALKSQYDNHMNGENAQAVIDVSLAARIKSRTELDLKIVQELFCRLLTNGIAISPPQGGVLGLALEPFTSLINHSCDPNVVVFFEGSELRVRSLRPIAAGDELAHAYTGINEDLNTRQVELESRYFFTCKCSRCELEASENPDNGLFETTRQHRSMQDRHRLQERIKNQADQVISDEDASDIENIDMNATERWHSHFLSKDNPLAMRTILASLAPTPAKLDTLSIAVRYAIQYQQYSKPKYTAVGPYVVHELFNLVQLYSRILSHIEAISTSIPDGQLSNRLPPTQDLFIIFYNRLYLLNELASIVYGSDTVYTQRISVWVEEAKTSNNMPPERGLEQAWASLEAWAG